MLNGISPLKFKIKQPTYLESQGLILQQKV